MSRSSNTVEQKLKQAIDSRKVVESARQHQVSTLSNFAAKLSLSCKGLDTELDNRLAKFRNALNKGMGYEDFAPLVDDILALLKNQEAIQLAHQRDLLTSVQNAGKQLQQTKGLPNDTRRTLRHLLDNELDDIQSVHGFIPVLNQLITFYHQALLAKSNDTFEPPNLSALTEKLFKLVSQLVLEEEANDELYLIKKRIAKNKAVDQLLDAAIDVITLIVQSIQVERASAQSFLTSLNQTLGELHSSLVSTREHSESMNVEFESINQRIGEKLKNLNTQTNKATSITELKQLVENELRSLSADILEKEQLEQKDRQILISSFAHINDRIGSLENKVSNYKKRLNEQRFKSLLDSLTKLPNRAAFDERYNHEINLFNEQPSDITLVVIDVDHFKSINDRFGHTAGDITLQVIAKALQKSIRQTDFIARYGGEEFVLLMPRTSLDNAVEHLNKLRLSIKKIPFKFKDKQIQITVSLGATQFEVGDTPLKAFDRADEALYDAKNSGRDRLCISK